MPTTVNKDIGGGANDYSDPATWEADTDNDLVTADQVQVGHLYGEWVTGTNLEISGATTDATRYRVFRAASGQGLTSTDPLRYDGTKGAAISSTANFVGATLYVTESHSSVEGIQVKTTGDVSAVYRTDNANLAYRCLFEGGSTVTGVANSAGVAGAKFWSCAIVNRGNANSANVLTLYQGGEVVNCTIVTGSDLTDPAGAIFINFPDGSSIFRNNVVCGSGGLSIGTPSVSTNNYTDAGSPPSGWTAITFSTSTSSGNTGFENITDSTRDFRLRSASPLVGAGTATGAPALDLFGTAFAGTPSVGADEGAVGVSLEQEGFRFGNDDGSESTHTWAAAQDVNITAPATEARLLNFLVDLAGDPGATTVRAQVALDGTNDWTYIPLH